MREMKTRMVAVWLTLCFLLLFVAGRCFYHQVIKGPEMARKASIMRSRGYAFPESGRGRILDRYCQSLTGTGQVWVCFGIPSQIQNFRGTSIKAAVLLNVEARIIEENLREAAKRKEAFVLLKLPINEEKTRRELNTINGILVVQVPRRYEEDGTLIHLLGNLGPGQDEKARVVGTGGLESRYEEDLKARATPSQINIIVDGLGNPIPGLSPKLRTTAVDACDVVTTIDRRIQLMTEDIADRHFETGAVVVLDISNRDILAMVSRPTYNPYDPSSYLANQNAGYHLNRALVPFYPGSLFKIAVAAAALENGLINTDETFFCPGYHQFSEKLKIFCWKPAGHGSITIARALAESCNAAFIEIGLRLGRTRLLQFCESAELFSREIIGYSNTQWGSHLEVDYGGPALGNASLGQKGVMMTPLQVANMVATVADNGVYKRPRMVREVRKGDQIVRILNQDQGKQAIDPAVSRTLREYLGLVTSTGTGRNAALSSIECGGKTATSQTGQYTESGEEILDTWFVGYFPAEKPRWVIAVLVEHGQSGGRNAAPVFKEIAEGIIDMYLP